MLIVPGLDGSGPDHWQSLWEAELGASARRIAPASWSAPDADDWLAAISAVAGRAADGGGLTIVAHSLGCLAAAMWLVANGGDGIRGALLVAPPDRDAPAFPARAAGFVPPRGSLPVPTIVVAADDDPYASPAASRGLADAWGAEYLELSGVGHVNAESGLGDWPQGRALLARLAGGASAG